MARWTDLADWRGPTVNEGDGDGRPGEPADRMSDHRGLVVHIACGAYEGTIAWERNPSANVSSHFVTARDGRCAQMVDTADRAWCQKAGNPGWLSVENEGQVGQALTAAQCEVIARLLARCHREYGVPLQATNTPSGRGLGYHSMGGPSWGHPACPGPAIIRQLPGIVARAKEIIEGDDVTPAEVTEATLLAKYRQYWKAPGGDRPLRTVADFIVSTEARGVESVAKLSDVETQIASLAAAVRALAAGGTSVDTAAVIAAVQEQGTQTRAAILDRLAAAGAGLGG